MPRKVAPKTVPKSPAKKPGGGSGGARATQSPVEPIAEPTPAPVPVPVEEIAVVMAPLEPPLAPPAGDSKPLSGASAAAAAIVNEQQMGQITTLGAQLLDERAATATQAARVLEEVLGLKPEMLVTVIDRFVTGVLGENPRVVQTCAAALPHMARLAPARVARHLQLLTDAFSAASPAGKDGLVRTFAALCSASVAYQKRLEPVLDLALGQADAKTLVRWTEIVLPALKGEPHARARAVVEGRVGELPRPVAQKLAEFLGIKLRRLAP